MPESVTATNDATIDLAMSCASWAVALPGAEALCAGAAQAALAAAGPALARCEISLVLGDDALLHRLNREWRGVDKPTNVLSFPAQDFAASAPEPLPDGSLPLGDVVLAFQTVEREATAQSKRLADHASHLVVHGVLHLLGYDHVVEAEAERMEALEREVLAQLGIADPYREIDGREIDRRDLAESATAGKAPHG